MKKCIAEIFLATVMALAWTPSVMADKKASSDHYAAIIDAGSSGSRIYLYRIRLVNGNLEIKDLFADEPQKVPALSEFAEHPQDAYLQGVAPLLEALGTFLHGQGLPFSRVKLHLQATGGLRQLNESKRLAILGAIRTALPGTGFGSGKIGMLAPEEEGVFAWADLNELARRLGPGQESLGIVEIGGASSQIAYEIKSLSHRNAKTWRIQGKRYRIFSQSFLGLGQNAARKSMIAHPEGGQLANPCYPSGVSVTDQKADVEGLSGNFDFDRCKALYRHVIQDNEDFAKVRLDDLAPIHFAGIGQGNPVGPIKGSIALWGLPGPYPDATLPLVKAFCKAGWQSFAARFGSVLVNQNQCANTTFVLTLLYDPAAGFGLSAHQLRHQEDFDGRTPSWTRGFFLVQGQSIL